MAEHEQRKKLSYRKVYCPHCGNDILAKSVNDEQKCLHCRRKYKISYVRRGKKVYWEPEAVDYNYEAEGRPWVGTNK